RRASRDRDAGRTGPIRGRSGSPFAIEGLCQDAGGRGLAGSPGPGKQVGVGHAVLANGVGEGAGNVLLAQDLLEGLGAVLAIPGEVSHRPILVAGHPAKATAREFSRARWPLRAAVIMRA